MNGKSSSAVCEHCDERSSAGTHRSCEIESVIAARQSVNDGGDGDSTTQESATLLYLLTMLTQKGARKVVRKAGNNGFAAYRQLCLMYGTSGQEGSTEPFVQIMTYKFGSKIERRGRPFERISGTGETIR